MRITIALIMTVFLTQSLLCAETINIIPTPKEMKTISGAIPLNEPGTIIVLGKNADKKSVLGAAEINAKIKELGGQPLPVVTENDADALQDKTLIIVGMPAENSLTKKYLGQNKVEIPDKEQGYVVVSTMEGQRAVYVLAGKDSQGTLYACVSFRYLVRKGENGLYAYNVEIKDWPDGLKRAVFVRAEEDSRKTFPYLDWCLRHKVNFAAVYIYTISKGQYAVPRDPKVIQELKKGNDYAAQRGIETMAVYLFWNIGVIAEDKGKPEFNGCVESGKGYWCFSRDDLIGKRAEEIAAFIKEAGFDGIKLHAKDGSPTEYYWSNPCSDCKARFGDDRAAADANFINIMYKTIRKSVPQARVAFVVEPYGGDLDIPENQPFQEFYRRLSTLIPEDVYLNNVSLDREAQDSWKKTIRQPVFHWRNLVMDPWHSGRDFSTMLSFAVKSGYYPNSKDILAPACHIAEGEIFPLQSAEFMWNVDAPGGFMLHSDVSAKPERGAESFYVRPIKKDNLPFNEWLWFKSTTEPKEVADDLLPRICEEAYGKEAAPMMTEILRRGVARRVLLMAGPVYQSAGNYNIVHDPEIIKDQYLKAEKAVAMLTAFKNEGKDIARVGRIFGDMQVAAIGGKSHYHLLMAEQFCKQKKIKEAQEELAKARANLAEAGKKLQKWSYSELSNIEKATESLAFRIAILSSAKQAKSTDIKVGIYNPNEVGGKVYGELPIYTTLLKAEGISPVFIATLENLFQYDCVIIPDCKKFGTKDQGTFLIVEKEVYKVEQALRDYVMKEGKGVLCYHDSVGLNRFALGRSVFPELCAGAKCLSSPQITINAEHPVTQGHKKGEALEHMYYDHIQMTAGETGTVIVADKDAPVVIAGELGKGRVVLNGTYIGGRNDNEPAAKEATGIDKDLLINSVYWLAGKK